MSSLNPESRLIFGIEGPAGSGKSTMANIVGREMGIPVIEGGRYYRQLTYAALHDGISLDDTNQLVQLANDIPSRFVAAKNGDVSYDGVDISEVLRTEEISTKVSQISRQLDVREVIESQIKDSVLAHDVAIIVGRAIKKLFPDAFVLHVTIDPLEAERRHQGRTIELSQSVRERNETDEKTAQALGVAGIHEATIDVTDLTPKEQADAMRNFIISHRS
jgi:cytidylate kinase